MFKIVVESPAFAEKTKLEQHKMVMDAISEDMPGIHAVNLKTRTPTELNVMNLGLGIMP
jgi:stress-induced morphogen